MEDKKESAEIREIIGRTAWYNGGLGLIVPPKIAKFLKKIGIKDGYTETKELPTTTSREE